MCQAWEEEFLGNYFPRVNFPRDRRYSGPRQHSFSLVGSHSHGLRQLHLFRCGGSLEAQRQTPGINNASSFSNTITTYTPIVLSRATLTALADCRKFHTTPQSPRWRLVTSIGRPGRLCGAHRLTLFQQLSRKRCIGHRQARNQYLE